MPTAETQEIGFEARCRRFFDLIEKGELRPAVTCAKGLLGDVDRVIFLGLIAKRIVHLGQQIPRTTFTARHCIAEGWIADSEMFNFFLTHLREGRVDVAIEQYARALQSSMGPECFAAALVKLLAEMGSCVEAALQRRRTSPSEMEQPRIPGAVRAAIVALAAAATLAAAALFSNVSDPQSASTRMNAEKNSR